jgi:hypothetical protein
MSERPKCYQHSGRSNHNIRKGDVMATKSYHMERRHFELIAEIIRKELDGEYREKAAYAFAYILPTTNQNFDSQRFLEACKVGR